MAFGINLHSIVRDAINSVHPDVGATLYRSTGRGIDASGQGIPAFAPALPITAQKQSESTATLFHADRVSQTEESRKFYLFSAPEPGSKITGIYRPLARGGDVFQLTDDKTWWLVDGMVEDFSNSGWVCVRATMQLKHPEGIEAGNG